MIFQKTIDGDMVPAEPRREPRGHKRPRIEIKIDSADRAKIEMAIEAEAKLAKGPKEAIGPWILAAALTRAGNALYGNRSAKGGEGRNPSPDRCPPKDRPSRGRGKAPLSGPGAKDPAAAAAGSEPRDVIRWRKPSSVNAPKDLVLCGDQSNPRRWYRIRQGRTSAEFRRNHAENGREFGAEYFGWESNDAAGSPFPTIEAAKAAAELHAGLLANRRRNVVIRCRGSKLP